MALPLARKVAESHAESGLVEFNNLQSVVDATKAGNDAPNFLLLVRYGVPAATNLSLALELMLKVLSFQHSGAYPHGHNLVTIVEKLPSPCLDRMRAAFLSRCSEARELRVGTFRLDLNPVTSSSSAVVPGHVATTLDDAIASLAQAYERWRYVYEKVIGNGLCIDFRSLLYLIDIVQGEIASYQGNSRASLTSEKVVVLSPNNSLEHSRER